MNGRRTTHSLRVRSKEAYVNNALIPGRGVQLRGRKQKRQIFAEIYRYRPSRKPSFTIPFTAHP